jgi:tRNA-2-methylthio-N6-dimethylallyladenosine synthase
MNVSDSERMVSLLEMMNYDVAPSPEAASLIIINSCSVREKPVHKVQSEVGRYRQLKSKNPDLRIGVAGCVAQQEKQRLLTSQPLIDFVFGPDAIDELPRLVRQSYESTARAAAVQFDHAKPYHIETLVRNPGVSAFVNITKGCDNFCTFCVVPFTRGRERSRPQEHVVKDVTNLVARGVKEVTLLGQNVNSYRSECGADFADLLAHLASETNIERIRYMTSHPKDFNEKLMQVMKTHRDKICEYIHLPFQSGNSEILERMNRGYTREEYIEKVAMIRSYVPDAVLSTDVIVGFPGETAQQFEDTMALLDQIAFENVYAFSYSPRPFTKAAKFEGAVPEDEKSRRLQRVIETHRETALKLANRYLGMTVKVLVEHRDRRTERWTGRSTQNRLIHFEGGEALEGQTVDVRISQVFTQTLRGHYVS